MTIEPGEIEVAATESPAEVSAATDDVGSDDGPIVEAAPVAESKPAAKNDFASKLAASKAATGEKAPAVVAKPVYNANYKFKVLDKELEFEEWAKGVVKDSETEKKVREFHEKAYGLESVKTDRTTLKTQLGETTTKLQEYETGFNNLHAAKAKKDYDSFFEAWDIPKEDLIKYALDIVKREEDPQAKAQWEQNRQQTYAQTKYQTEQQNFEQERQKFSVEKRLFELSGELSRPDVTPFAQTYEAGTGKPGSFKEFVQQIGASVFATTGRDIPASEAVQIAMGHLRAANPTLGVQAENGSPALKVVQPSNKPVIPNVRGSGGSPVRTAPKSVADLKARAKEMSIGNQ